MPALTAWASRPLAVLGVLGVAFVLYTQVVAAGAAKALDLNVAEAVESAWWPPLQPMAQGIAVLGGVEVTALIAIGLAASLWAVGFRAEAAALVIFPLLVGLEALYKYVVAHPPPLAFSHSDGPSLVTMLHRGTLTFGGSYPSGHMMRTVFVYGLGAFVVSRLAPPRWGRPAVAAAATVVGLMALDRVYLGVHWQSDVVGGLLLGGALLAGAIAWLDRPVRPAGS
ncbi:MAG TPA: phosphatase PAP2 family protein [Candidatus Dormibacteraeota bacterium]|nr:phosphatase PAP2 family protein [Candidatus Dormibacteraeota bacterium]